MKDFAHEQAHRLGLTVGPQLTAAISEAAAATDIVLVADPGAGRHVVIEDLQLTLAAAGTVSVWTTASTSGTRATGDHVKAAGELTVRLQNMVASAASEAMVLGRTNIAVGGHVVYRILS